MISKNFRCVNRPRLLCSMDYMSFYLVRHPADNDTTYNDKILSTYNRPAKRKSLGKQSGLFVVCGSCAW